MLCQTLDRDLALAPGDVEDFGVAERLGHGTRLRFLRVSHRSGGEARPHRARFGPTARASAPGAPDSAMNSLPNPESNKNENFGVSF
jgi:hypothetical protein